MLSNVETGYKLRYGPAAQDIQGKTIVMVGGASQTTRNIASLLSGYGAQVFFITHDPVEYQAMLAYGKEAGGHLDGMVIDMCHPEEVQRCFAAVEQRFGTVHALVNTMAMDGAHSSCEDIVACQNLFTQEAIQRMQAQMRGQIVNIGQGKKGSPSRSFSAALRRQASEVGIRITLIEPSTESSGSGADAIANCVMDSLIQPFGVDVIFLSGQSQSLTV